ncbi:MAG: MBL fold metallo-hydrolase, partial [Firmicutes bacterium]|nr:MBL fold metallo-hydrolase [Bacillota bacterium]
MSLSFCSLSSGSSGNCYIVTTEDTALLVDAGISGKRIFEGLSALGIPDEKLMGLLVTHEHIDHVKSVRILTKKKPFINVYGS